MCEPTAIPIKGHKLHVPTAIPIKGCKLHVPSATTNTAAGGGTSAACSEMTDVKV